MTFGWVGYVWAIFGCCIVVGGVAATAAVLYMIGRRVERRDHRAVHVETISSRDAAPARDREDPPRGGPES